MAQRFVERYEAEGEGHKSVRAFILATPGFTESTYYEWRREIPGFAAKVDLVDAAHRGVPVPETLVAGLSRPQEMFIIHFRETGKRADALDLVGWTTKELQSELTDSEEFRIAYELLEEQRVMRIEDEGLNQAQRGANMSAVRLALQAYQPDRYHRRSGDSAPTEREGDPQPSPEGVRASARKWGDRFGFHAEEG